MLRRRAVLVAVEVNEASTVVAKGTVAVPGASKVFRLRKASRQLAAGAKATLKLKLSEAGVESVPARARAPRAAHGQAHRDRQGRGGQHALREAQGSR